MLTMDEREARNHPDVVDELASLLGDEFETGELYSGDFAGLDIPLSIGIERKSFTNLCSSLTTGELDEQLARLVKVYDVPVLLVEGIPLPDKGGRVRQWTRGGKKGRKGKSPPGLPYSWIVSTLGAWFGRGVMTYQVESLKATPLTVVHLYNLYANGEHRDVYAPRNLLPSLRELKLSARMLYQFPGIGPTRAKLVEGIAPAQMAEMGVEEWQGLLGDVIGKRVWKLWNEEG